MSTRGTHAIDGLPMSWRTCDAIRALGLGTDGHRSHQLGPDDLVDADLVLAMAAEHVEYVRRVHPDAGGPDRHPAPAGARDAEGLDGDLAARLAVLQLDRVASRRGRTSTTRPAPTRPSNTRN